jgi:hypothetical protein
MFFRAVGVAVCVVVGAIFLLDLIGHFVSENQRNEPPTIINVPSDVAASSDIVKYLSERQGNNVLTAPPEDASGYQAQCLEDWTKRGVVNEEMVNYCISVERDGYSKLVDLLQKYGGYSWMPGVLQKSMQDWTKRGARKDSQIAYDVGLQVDAFLDLKYIAEHPPGIREAAANSCLSEWSSNSIQWTQVEYCYKRVIGQD